MKRVVVLSVCAGIALSGCGAKSQPASQPPASTRVQVSQSLAPPAAVKVPEQLKFTAKTVDGKEFNGESLAGKPVVVWFWTPWCPRCQGEAEDIAAAAKESGDAVRFLGVAAQDQVSAMKRFVREYNLGSFTHINDADGVIWKRFGVIEQPSHAFITADGEVEMVLRQLPTNDLLERVRALRQSA